jgi:cystathionine beta-synthase
MGYSAGTAVAGLLKMKDRFKPEDVVVVIFHDHGSRYVGKIYNDEWMRERGFLDEKITAANILDAQKNKELVSIEPNDTLARALQLIKNHELSQLPVIENGEVMGTILEDQMIDLVLNCGNKPESVQVHSCMRKALPVIGRDATLQEISRRIDKSSPAVLVQEEDRKYRIITQYDLLKYLY